MLLHYIISFILLNPVLLGEDSSEKCYLSGVKVNNAPFSKFLTPNANDQVSIRKLPQAPAHSEWKVCQQQS